MDSSDLLFNKYQDSQSFCTDAFDIVQQVCASSNNLPEAGEEYDFYQSFTEVADVLASFRNRLLISVNKLLKNYTSSPPLGSLEENADEHIETLIEANDELLERISNGIDEAGGVRKHSTTVVKTKTSTWRSPAVRYSDGVGMIPKSDHLSRTDQPYQSILKPQLNFSDPVDNTDAPFIPKLNFKPNSIKPLPFKLTCNRRRLTSDLLCRQPEILDHPYLCEIECCNSDESLLVIRDPKSPAEWNECPFTLVNSKNQLCEMVESLKLCKEIAIDLEHHSLRSYMGFTCLIQISTRAADFIVDAFSLREHLHLLNEITTNSSILKVFHGADNDIVWLQKDFGVYVVNMFDTHQAARILGFPYLSLSYLLKRYCDVDTAKRYQRADWRVRPLPSELVDYARTDTHYLLYIYDLLRNELVEKGTTTNNLLHTVFDRSKCICLKKYEKPMFQDTDFLKLIKNSCRVFNSRQLHALKLLYAWRDRVAREEDESVDYVLPNHMLMKIAEYLPKEKQGIFGCCNPIPIHVKQNLVEIHQYVISAREVELKKQEEDFANEDEYFEPPPFDPESVLNCVHDHIHSSDNVTKEFEDVDTLWGAVTHTQLQRNNEIKVITEKANDLSILSKFKKQTYSATNIERVMISMANPLIKYLPDDMICPVEKQFLQSEVRRRALCWRILPVEQHDQVEETDQTIRKIEVIPTPAEINNADDIVPLKRRRHLIPIQQPPQVPLLTSYLQKVAAERDQCKANVTSTIKHDPDESMDDQAFSSLVAEDNGLLQIKSKLIAE